MKKKIKIEFEVFVQPGNMLWLENRLQEVSFEIQDIFSPAIKSTIEVTDGEPTVH